MSDLNGEAVFSGAVLACGSRYCRDVDQVYSALEIIRDEMPALLVIHGDEPQGADSIIAHWADRRAEEAREYKADWMRYGPSAGPRRNMAMLGALEERPERKLVLAFWDARVVHCGTFNMIREATSRGIDVVIVPVKMRTGSKRA